jgi:hypothetical protein
MYSIWHAFSNADRSRGQARYCTGHVGHRDFIQVSYDGNLAIDGTPVTTNVIFGRFNFDATDFYDPAVAKVNVTSSYDGSSVVRGVPDANVPFVTNLFTSAPIAAFQDYDFTSNKINSIGVSISNSRITDKATKIDYFYSLSTPNPTVLTGGNSTALTGRFLNDPTTGSGGALTFGTLTGTAVVQTATLSNKIFTPGSANLDANGDPTGGYLSPFNMM